MSKHHKHGGKFVSQKVRLAIYLRDNLTCLYCGEKSADLTLDHVTPISQGGANSYNNLVTCCRSCNSKKQDRELKSFATLTAYFDILNAVTQDMTFYLRTAKNMINNADGYTNALRNVKNDNS